MLTDNGNQAQITINITLANLQQFYCKNVVFALIQNHDSSQRLLRMNHGKKTVSFNKLYYSF